ncbi:MAG TPA: FMN-binding protein [Gaiellaceae bacterium]|jgi:uncharacterized protein with FMN-binding domain|nr:FMN-binding protein [Gaiellaceae bacterium]
MKTKFAAVLSAFALSIPVAQAAAATRSGAVTTTAKKIVTKKVTGISATADRWGTVQVVVTAKITTVGTKKTIRYTDLGGTYSYHTDRSQYVMSESLPTLRQEFLSVQSANVQQVSGASATSQAFEQSLQSALGKLSK